MTQIFSPAANLMAWLSVAGLGVLIVAGVVFMFAYQRSRYMTNAGVEVLQPVPFSHQHHVGGLGIDCRYCHTTVESSPSAGMPSTETCMTCHKEIYTSERMLAPLRESWRENEPIRWRRVYHMPDFVFFDHSIHVAQGVGCTECHGDVDAMPLVHKNQPTFMKWCLDCHQHPEQRVRPREEVFSVAWERPVEWEPRGTMLAQEYDIEHGALNDCTMCHR